MKDTKTLTRNDLAKLLRPTFGATNEAYRFVGVFFDLLKDDIANHNEVKIHGFGVFRCLNKTARVGRNLRTGKSAKISARRVVSFVAGAKFKQQMRAEEDDNA